MDEPGDTFDDDMWDRVSGHGESDEGSAADEAVVDPGPPVRVTIVIRSETIPVAPWAQGWRIGALGPVDGFITLICEHDVELSPVAQLSAITGLLGTVKQAQLDLVWWAIQTRGPIEAPATDDLDQELADLLEAEGRSED